jgi:gamma-glutamylcyclotransferase (GGCT)/AIG2-like uncharacterized protein YtfP
MHTLFVYGTLRKGESNHGLLGSSRLVSLLARASGSLVDTGFGYPAMTEGAGFVWGEIYEADDATLSRIDELEDYFGPGDPRNLYERVETDVCTERGTVKAMAYVSDRFRMATAIPHGDWKLHQMMRLQNVLFFAHGSCPDEMKQEAEGEPEPFWEKIGRGQVPGCYLHVGRQFGRNAQQDDGADPVASDGVAEGVLYRIPAAVWQKYLHERETGRFHVCRPVVIPVTLDNERVVDAVTLVGVGK